MLCIIKDLSYFTESILAQRNRARSGKVGERRDHSRGVGQFGWRKYNGILNILGRDGFGIRKVKRKDSSRLFIFKQ